jgi:RimJ/RimL family protein N-acetyltransferase
VSITIRRARADDVDFLFELITDEETRPFLGRVAETRDDVLAEIQRSEREPHAYGRFVIEVEREPAGTVGFTVENERHRIAEVGRFALHPRFRGRRLGDDAARVFQRHMLVDLDFHRIELQIYAFNERAIAHAERSGFVREGVKRRAYFRDGEWHDAVLFSLLSDEVEWD